MLEKDHINSERFENPESFVYKYLESNMYMYVVQFLIVFEINITVLIFSSLVVYYSIQCIELGCIVLSSGAREIIYLERS